jgi:beta-N-acetylhexosaminidase
MLMTDHVAYPALDPAPGTPATLSYPIMHGVLRGTLGFRGAAVTDCMNMHAVAHNFESRESTVLAVLAGCDLVLTHQWDLAYDALRSALREGRLSEARLREAAERVLTLKTRIFGTDLQRPAPIDATRASAAVGTAEHTAVADRIAAASITVVDGALASSGAHPLIIVTRMARRFGPSVEAQVRAALGAIGWEDAHLLMVDPTPDAAQTGQALQAARAAHAAAILHFNQVTSFDPEAVLVSDELVALARQIGDSGARLTIASLGSPYVLSHFSRPNALLCTYSTCDASVRALLRVLAGSAGATGRLPVLLS